MESVAGFSAGDTIMLLGADPEAADLNGRTYRITSVVGNVLQVATGDLGLPDENISVNVDANTPFIVLSDPAKDVEALFEGEDLMVDG